MITKTIKIHFHADELDNDKIYLGSFSLSLEKNAHDQIVLGVKDGSYMFSLKDLKEALDMLEKG